MTESNLLNSRLVNPPRILCLLLAFIAGCSDVKRLSQDLDGSVKTVERGSDRNLLADSHRR